LKIKPIIIYSTLVAALIALLFMVLGYKEFHRSLNVFNEISFSDSRAEVLYRLGQPTYVLGPIENWGSWQTVYYLHGPKGDPNTMPSDTQLDDYNEWFYQDPNSQYKFTNSQDTFNVTFNTKGLIESITFYSNTTNNSSWGPIAGICNGDPEEKVLHLGEPSLNSIKGTIKTIEFSDIGLEFNLTKGRVYRVKVRNSKKKEYSTLVRFLNSLF
jgi:hypothetical protein